MKYYAYVSVETKAEIESFLQANPEEKVSYEAFLESKGLCRKAFSEIFDSMESFRKDWDSIFEKYSFKMNCEYSAANIEEMKKFNVEIAELYDSVVQDKKSNDLISELGKKRYW